jgi:2-polyprenyl-3-methyl-5-hydroxy-6-metoxy-1,4-benzoquinol methylase
MAELSYGPASKTCPACLGPGRALRLTYGGRYRLHRCAICRTQYFRAGRRLAEETASEYWEDYKFGLYADPAVQAGYEERYTKVLNAAARLRGTPVVSVLDIGCGIGNFLAYAESKGLVAYGADVDGKAVAAAKDRGLNAALTGDLDTLFDPDERVDAVTLWDVIEHVFTPDDVVAPAVDRLAPDGVLLLETPDGAFPLRTAVRAVHAATGGRADLTRSLYYWEHKSYFTVAGLRSILRRHGCEIAAVRRETSPRAKMQQMFDYYAGAEDHTRGERLLARAWPVMESAARRAGAGNKLIVVARKAGPA